MPDSEKPVYSVSGYVYGDRSAEDVVAVCLRIREGRKLVPHNREFSGSVYKQFSELGLTYEHAQFRLDIYRDKSIKVVPVDARPNRKLKLSPELQRLKVIEEAELEKIPGTTATFDSKETRR